MLQGSLIILAFVIIAALMMTKKIPTLLALPLMAVVICLIAGVPAVGVNAEGTNIGWLQTVLEAGTVRMGSAIMAVVFGAWLGVGRSVPSPDAFPWWEAGAKSCLRAGFAKPRSGGLCA